jgi:hypothetical protein
MVGSRIDRRHLRHVLRVLRETRAPLPAHEHALAGTRARHAAIDEVLAEVEAFGVRMPLEFIWAIDGSGVEEDKPMIVHLHRGMLAAKRVPARVLELADRVSSIDLRSTVRHEIGHALLFHDPRAATTPAFRALFGDVSRRYRVGHAVNEIARRLDRHRGFANPRYRHVVSLYAATHPHEAFAEAVRIALATAGDSQRIAAWIARHDVAPTVTRQIEYAADWLTTYRRHTTPR